MFDQSIADTICQQLAEGVSLREACAPEGMPDHSTVLKWVRENDAFRNQYTRAREDGDDYEFEGLAALSDEPPEKTAAGNVDPGWVAWQKNRIDTRKWTLARKRPKKYGDKLDLDVKGSLAVKLDSGDGGVL